MDYFKGDVVSYNDRQFIYGAKSIFQKDKSLVHIKTHHNQRLIEELTHHPYHYSTKHEETFFRIPTHLLRPVQRTNNEFKYLLEEEY